MENADMPAMPCEVQVDLNACNQARALGRHVPSSITYQGMTKREMMAMHMMAAILVGTESPNIVWCASIATDAADKLIFELERTKGESK